MKRAIVCFITSVFMILSLCACGGKGDAKCSPDLLTPFSVKAEIEYEDMKSEAVFKKYENSDWDVEFASPDTLAGVILSFRENNVEASYKGLSFSVPKSALPLKSIIAAFIEASDSLSKKTEITGDMKDDEIVVEGETELGNYTMKFTADNTLSGFEMENLKLVIKFSEYAVNDQTQAPESTQPQETVPQTEAQTESAVTDMTVPDDEQ